MRPKKNNILLVANYESDVGYAWWLMENFWVQIALHFTAQNRKCYLVYPKINKIPIEIQNAPISLIEHDFADPAKKHILKKIIKAKDITSVYLTDKKYFDTIYLQMRMWGVNKIVLHDHAPGERTRVKFIKKKLKTFMHAMGLISCDHYIGVSKFVYDRFIDKGCINPKKCSYVLNGIKPIDIDASNRYYAHDTFRIPKDAVIIVTTGRATFYKGIDFLIKCAHHIINEEEAPNTYFLHCGHGPDIDAFKDLAAHHNLTQKFIFAGQREDIPRILQSCDIGVQASMGEAFSLSILEYMSAGLATVVPNHCGNGEAVVSGRNGILYTPGDIALLSGILLELTKDKQLRSRLASEGIKTVKERLNIDTTNKNLIDVLSKEL